MATVDYALQNNVGLTAYYGFDWKTQKGTDKADFYRADLNYKFNYDSNTYESDSYGGLFLLIEQPNVCNCL